LLEADTNIDENGNKIFPDTIRVYLIIIALCLIYPVLYDGNQLISQLGEYFQDPWNYLDICHISMGYYNVWR
jgi:hypothetical protein